MTIRVVVAEDQAMVRAGLAALLDAADDIHVVGEAADGDEVVHLARTLEPDVVRMDVRMPRLDGIEPTRQLLSGELPEGHTLPRILMLTTFDIDEYIYEAMRAGASGFLLKDAPPAELTAAVRIVARGDALLNPTVTRRVIEHFVHTTTRRPDHISVDVLTPREKEMLLMIARGLSSREIADELVLAEQTVKSHVSRILGKLDLRDRAHAAVVVAYESGLAVPRDT